MTIDAGDDGEIVTIDPEGGEDYRGGPRGLRRAAVRARILWPALGFPAVIAPGGKSDAEATRCITLLVLSNQRALTPDAVARHLRCVPWAERGRRHIAENFVAANDVTILAPKMSFTGAERVAGPARRVRRHRRDGDPRQPCDGGHAALRERAAVPARDQDQRVRGRRS